MVERDLAKVEVAGSTPVSRSRIQFCREGSRRVASAAPKVDIFRSGSYFNIRQGAVPKW